MSDLTLHCREIPIDLWEESTREEFQPSANGQIVKVINPAKFTLWFLRRTESLGGKKSFTVKTGMFPATKNKK